MPLESAGQKCDYDIFHRVRRNCVSKSSLNCFRRAAQLLGGGPSVSSVSKRSTNLFSSEKWREVVSCSIFGP